jgi:hypothetical protein
MESQLSIACYRSHMGVFDPPVKTPPLGNPQPPTNSQRPDLGGWKPGMGQNTESLRGQVKPWPAIVRPRTPFRVG